MRAGVRALLLALAVCAATSHAQQAATNNNNSENNKPQQRSVWDEPIRFTNKAKDVCTMVVSGAGDYTRLRVSCKGPNVGQVQGRSYYCDFQGKPNLCRAYNTNPRHYFTQMMWDMRKLNHACEGPRVYKPAMCKKYPEEAHMTFLAAWPKPAATPAKPAKPAAASKPVVPAQPTAAKPVQVVTPKPAQQVPPKPAQAKPQPAAKPQQPGKPAPAKKPTPKPGKAVPKPTESAEGKAARLAQEYCWKSFHGICTYFIGWFQN